MYHSLKDAASKYTEVEKLFVAGWGSLLYLNIDQYKGIPDSQLASMDHVYDVAKEYAEARSSNDRDTMLDLDEWIEEGGPMKGGLYLFNYNRMDRILRSAAEKTKLKEPLTIIRAERTSRSLDRILEKNGIHGRLAQSLEAFLVGRETSPLRLIFQLELQSYTVTGWQTQKRSYSRVEFRGRRHENHKTSAPEDH